MTLHRLMGPLICLGLLLTSACSSEDEPLPPGTGGTAGAGGAAGGGGTGTGGIAGAGGTGGAGAAPSCGGGDVYPGSDWEVASPESQGVAADALQDGLDYFEDQIGPGALDETVVIRHGRLIWSGPDIDNVHEIYSATKTFTATVLGLLVRDGTLGVDTHAVDLLPSLDDDYPSYADIELRQLATMSAGYRGAGGGCWSLHEAGQYDEYYQCVQTYTDPGPPDYPAGERWEYHDAEVHLLGFVLTLAAEESLEDMIRTRLADPIGMSGWDWSDYGLRDGVFLNNPAGTPNDPDGATMNDVQGGINASARELGRYGLLYLNRGCWQGRQLLDPTFVDQAGSNQIPSSIPPDAAFDLTGRYGYYWWTNGVREDGTRPWPSAPDDAYTAHGYGRNSIFILPGWDMVIIRLSPDLSLSNSDALWEGLFSRLAPGIQ